MVLSSVKSAESGVLCSGRASFTGGCFTGASAARFKPFTDRGASLVTLGVDGSGDALGSLWFCDVFGPERGGGRESGPVPGVAAQLSPSALLPAGDSTDTPGGHRPASKSSWDLFSPTSDGPLAAD